MTVESLKYMNECLEELSIPYGFGMWNEDLTLPFWVGDYIEVTNPNEDGLDESTFILYGTAEDFLTLETHKQKIKAFFPNEGRTEILPNGSGIAVMYDTAILPESNIQGIHRMQINLNIKEWKGN